MPYFKIEYRQKSHKKSLKLQAPNRIEALRIFQKSNMGTPLSISKSSKPISDYFKDINLKFSHLGNRGYVKTDSYVVALQQIGIMTDAGMPINTALEETILFTTNPQLKYIFGYILKEIENGKSLSQSSRYFKKQLGELSISMFYLGEQSGRLSEAFLKLADILEKIQKNRRMLKKATRYPLFIITAMIIAFTIIITMVVPQFQELFASEKLELPFPTRFLLWTEEAIIQFGPYILIGAFFLVIIYSSFYKKSPKIRLKTDKMMLRIYIVGDVIRYAMLGRFIYIFQVLLKSGIPIIQALDGAIGVVDNQWIHHRLKRVLIVINDGRSLYEGFEESGIFDRIIIQMIKTGEDGGALDRMLEKSYLYYNDRYQYIVDNIATLIEPVLITAIAGFVLILALGIFLPMWNMVSIAG